MFNTRVLLAEFIGTFALVFVGVLAVNHLGAVPGGLVGIALANGLTIAAMAWATASISGGHLNPAVSFALWIARKIDAPTFLGYALAQIVGAVAAASVLMFAMPEADKALIVGTPSLGAGLASNETGAIVFEAIATFFMVFVIFSTTLERLPNRVATLFIGLTVSIGVLAIGPYTGAALNPARYLGPAVVSGRFQEAWIYMVGPLLGAAAVAALFMTRTFEAEQALADAEEIVTVEHVPSEPHKHEEVIVPQAVVEEPTISPDPPRYLSYVEPTSQPYIGGQQPVAPSFTEPGLAANGQLNFTSIYRMANLPEVPFTAEQVLDMLNAMPTDLPLESKRAALEVTLKTLGRTNGTSQDSVLADATRKVQALATFADSYTDQANQYILKTQHDMEMMEAEIEKRQRGVEEATHKQTQMVEACQAEADRLERVFEIFETSKA